MGNPNRIGSTALDGRRAPLKLDYSPTPTCRKFHKSDKKVRGIQGPIGSGKSSACVWEIMIRAIKQEADPQGQRRTRWAVIRNTYLELISTTLKTFREWFPEPICTYRADKPLSARIKFPLPDATTVDCEVIFLACDRVEDAGKFRSLEITGAWVNEASEIDDIGIIDIISGRCGRFPKKWKDRDGNKVGGPTWNGMILDTNAPDDEHWWYEKAEIDRPDNWDFFYQPPAVLLAPGSTPQKPVYVPNEGQNPNIPPAENIENIPIGWKYYIDQIPGKPYEYIKVFLMAQYGTVSYGKPVYPEYNDMVHYAGNNTDKDGKPIDVGVMHGLPLLLGFDFGIRHSACIIAQLSVKGQLRFIEEILGVDVGIRQFARDVIKPRLANGYPGMRLIVKGDPAGAGRAATDESTCLSILNEEGIPATACHTNVFRARREAVSYFLTRMVNGEPGLLVGSKCPVLRKGFLGRYCFKRVTSATRGESYSGEPVKDDFSHPHDAAQYIAAGLLQNDGAMSSARSVRENERYPGVGPGGGDVPEIPQAMDMKGYF